MYWCDMSIKVVADTVVVKKPVHVLTIGEVLNHYGLSNQVDGKSPKTIAWYSDMLMTFSGYMKEELE